MNIVRLKLAIVVCALFVAAQARASLFDLTFLEHDAGPTIANGQIDVVGGLAISGFLDVTGGPNMGHYTLVAPGSDGSFVWDNAVTPGATPFLPGTGLTWAASGIEFNLYYNFTNQWDPIGTYSLWGNYPGNWNPVAYGEASLKAVPDGGLVVALLGGVFACIAAFRRRFVF